MSDTATMMINRHIEALERFAAINDRAAEHYARSAQQWMDRQGGRASDKIAAREARERARKARDRVEYERMKHSLDEIAMTY